MRQKNKRLWALFLAAVLLAAQLPAVARAENAPEDGSIASFEPLDSGVANQAVTVGTELSGLNLPDKAAADVYHVTQETVPRDGEAGKEESVSDNDAGASSGEENRKAATIVTTSVEEIPVAWNSVPSYDGGKPGEYIFTADAGGYILSGDAKLPQITVTVTAENVENKTETGTEDPRSTVRTLQGAADMGKITNALRAAGYSSFEFTDPGPKTYGDPPFTLHATGGNGVCSFESSDPSIASVEGNTVTIHKAGSVELTARYASINGMPSQSSHTVTIYEAVPDISLELKGYDSSNIIVTVTVSPVGTGKIPKGEVTFSVALTQLVPNGVLDNSGKTFFRDGYRNGKNMGWGAEFLGEPGYYGEASIYQTYSFPLDQPGFAINDPGSKTYGDDDFTLTASGGEGSGNVSFSAPAGNGVLTVEADGSAKITGAGKVTVTAAKASWPMYNPNTYKEITVNPRQISNVTVDVTGGNVYTGGRMMPAFTVNDGKTAIASDDYDVSYGPNVGAGTGAGSITLTGKRNYTGTKTVQFDIVKRPLGGAAVTLEASSYTYTGGEIRPAVTKVVAGGITVLSTEFDVTYADNINEGQAAVTVTARAGGNFTGSASGVFEIKKSANPSGGNSDPGSEGPSVPDGNDSGSAAGSAEGDPDSGPEPQNSYTVTDGKFTRNISVSGLQRLSDSGSRLTFGCGPAGMTFSPAALQAVLAAVPEGVGDITFSIASADLSAFPDAAALLGGRPVYDFGISYRDSLGNIVRANINFPAGTVSIVLNYTPAPTELTGCLFIVYVDGAGNVMWLDKSGYDRARMLGEVSHFSVYGVAYKTPETVFTDITDHWAKEAIEFAAARKLFSGMGQSAFEPDAPLTRGMFVTALGRLEGINPENYQTRSFSDVKADSYYAPYIEWAAQKRIIPGAGGLFGPDAILTREQMAVVMAAYAGQAGYSLPAPLAAAAFADSDKISVPAAGPVTALQRAGIIKGKDGNLFDPQGNATRADGAAVLHRFVKSVIDPDSAVGWAQNDSGSLIYYPDGRD